MISPPYQNSGVLSILLFCFISLILVKQHQFLIKDPMSILDDSKKLEVWYQIIICLKGSGINVPFIEPKILRA